MSTSSVYSPVSRLTSFFADPLLEFGDLIAAQLRRTDAVLANRQTGGVQNVLLLVQQLVGFLLGRSTTAALLTASEQTTQRMTATIKVLKSESRCCIACDPPADVGLDHEIVDQRCKHIPEQESPT